MGKNFLLLFILCIISVIRLIYYWQNIPVGQDIRIEGRIYTEPLVKNSYQIVSIGGYKVILGRYPQIEMGDRLIVEGSLEQSRFIKRAKIIKLEENTSYLYKFRENAIAAISHTLPSKEAALLTGVSLGSKSLISDEFWDELKKTGTAHVVVASGMNVALVGGFVLNSLAGLLTRRRAVIIAIISIWTYTVLSGMDSPLIRASIMFSMTLAGQIFGRAVNPRRILVATFISMLVINPSWSGDLGFWMSFCATYTLSSFYNFVHKYVQFLPKIISGSLASTISAQIGVTPILIAFFGSVNIASPFINALILWVIPPLTIVSMVAGITSVISISLSKAILLLFYPLAWWFVRVVELFSN